MKKIFAFAFAFILSVSIFALYSEDYSMNFEAEDEFSNESWIINRNVGIGVPIIKPNFGAISEPNFIGANLSYKQQHIYWPNGFVFQFEASQSVLRGVENIPIINYDCKFYGIENTFMIGLGFGFISDRKLFVTLAGCVGIDNSVMFADYSIASLNVVTLSLVAGIDLSATLRLTKHLGCFASIFAGAPITGGAWETLSLKYNSLYYSASAFETMKLGQYYIKPSIGVSVTFGD